MQRDRKAILITGCGRRRVGDVVAEYLARRGWDIAVHCHRSVSQAEENAARYRALGARAEVYSADIACADAVQHMVAGVVEKFGAIDGLLTTASTWDAIPLEHITADDMLASFRVNTLGTFLCCQCVGLQMVTQDQGGSIVTIGDSLTEHPYRDYAAYFTAKGAIATMTRAMAVELGNRNRKVRVNCVAPGPVMFPEGMTAEQADWVANSTLTKIVNHPQSVAAAVEFLLNTPMMTGAVIPVESGRNVGREQLARSEQPDVP